MGVVCLGGCPRKHGGREMGRETGRRRQKAEGPHREINTKGNWSLIPGVNSQDHCRTEASERSRRVGEEGGLCLCSHLLLINGYLGEGHEFSLPACHVQG